MSYDKKIKIILTGGGTAGSVAPLLGIVDELRKSNQDFDFLWLGTKYGPEKEMVEADSIKFRYVLSGKWRRYFSLMNVLDIMKIFFAFWQSLIIIIKEKPGLILSAGSFVSVPVIWAAWASGVPVLAHQQDARPGLANRLMAPFARKITVTFAKSMSDYGSKAQLVGNSVRQEIKDYKITPREAKQLLGLSSKLPVVLIMGGGTGAVAINDVVEECIPELTKYCQVVHVSGKGKNTKRMEEEMADNPNYKMFEFLDANGVIKVFTAADLVVSRAGMSTLTELSYLAKPAIIIPMPDSHQEDNAAVFAEEKAAVIIRQENLNAKDFTATVKNILRDTGLRQQLSLRINSVIPNGGNENIAAIILEILNK